jgi:hypothetical protein
MSCTHSCSVFLKAMARGDEHCSKHRQDVGASSSGLSTKPKKLVKRPRPSSYQEESSSEVSSPRGGTSDETECLRMHSPEIHTNRKIVNYSKEDPINVMHLHNKPCYSSSKEKHQRKILDFLPSRLVPDCAITKIISSGQAAVC